MCVIKLNLLLDRYDAKIAKICNFCTFWPVNQLIIHLFKIRQKPDASRVIFDDGTGFFAHCYQEHRQN